jgi:hypothetical protein
MQTVSPFLQSECVGGAENHYRAVADEQDYDYKHGTVDSSLNANDIGRLYKVGRHFGRTFTLGRLLCARFLRVCTIKLLSSVVVHRLKISFTLNLFESEVCNDAHDGGEERKDSYDLDFAPAALFKMMVDGRHLEKAFSVSQLEVYDLNDYRQTFKQIEYACDKHDRGISEHESTADGKSA